MHKKRCAKKSPVQSSVVKTGRVTRPVPEDELPIKILFLGNENVGKTTFIMAYINHLRNFYRIETYAGNYLAYTQYILEVERHGRHYSVWLLDVPIGSTVAHRVDQYPAKVDIVVMCYAVDDPNSLDNIFNYWLPELARHYENLLPRYHLLGLKNDLRNDQVRIEELAREGRHPVALLDVLEVHQTIRSFRGEYMECSALTNPEQAVFCMKILIDQAFVYRGLHLPV